MMTNEQKKNFSDDIEYLKKEVDTLSLKIIDSEKQTLELLIDIENLIDSEIPK